MKNLIVFFDEPAPVITEAVHIIFALVGGLDLATPIKHHRYGMNICEDYIGYAVKAPREFTLAEVHAVAVQLANHFGTPASKPEDDTPDRMLWAINETMRAIATHNGLDLTNTMTSLDIVDPHPDDILFELSTNLADGSNVVNYTMTHSTHAG